MDVENDNDEAQEPNAQERYENELAAEVAKLQLYRQAIEEEFKDLDADDPKTAKAARNKLLDLVPDAAQQIAILITHASSEAVRANLSKFVFTEAMKAADAGKTSDTWEALFAKLKPDAEPAVDE